MKKKKGLFGDLSKKVDKTGSAVGNMIDGATKFVSSKLKSLDNFLNAGYVDTIKLGDIKPLDGKLDEYGYNISKWAFPTDKEIDDKEAAEDAGDGAKADDAEAAKKMKRSHSEDQQISLPKVETPFEDNKEAKKVEEPVVEEHKEERKTEEVPVEEKKTEEAPVEEHKEERKTEEAPVEAVK